MYAITYYSKRMQNGFGEEMKWKRNANGGKMIKMELFGYKRDVEVKCICNFANGRKFNDDYPTFEGLKYALTW